MSDEMVYTIMKHDIIAVNETAIMKQAIELMRTKHIRHLPVVNSNSRIVGILSDRDTRVVRNAMKVNDYEQTVGFGQNDPVKDHMSFPVLEARASDSIGLITKRMLNSKVSCLMIVDEYSAPCGIVTTDDILIYLVKIIGDNDLQLDAQAKTLFQY